MDYISLAEYCDKYHYDRRNTARKIAAGRIPGAKKIGKQWVVPEDAEPLTDTRYKSGKYVDWRKGQKKGMKIKQPETIVNAKEEREPEI